MEFADQPVGDFISFAKTVMLFGAVAFATWGFISFLSSSRLLFAILFPILAGFSSAMCYLSLTIGSHLSCASIEIALGNDADMWFSVITPGMATAVFAGIILGGGLAYIRWTRVNSSGKTCLTVAIIGAIVSIGSMILNERAARFIGNRLPYSIYSSFSEYYDNRVEASIERTTYINTSASSAPDAPDIIFIIGEALRADHLPMNGYHRNTLPNISKDSLLINYPRLWSEYTHTNYAVPNLLTRFCPQDPYRMFDEQSFITIFKNAGYKTAWFANQNLSRFYTYFANEADTIFYCNNGNSEFRYDAFLDTDIIPPLKKWLEEGSPAPRLAIVHTIGSHWWYPTHYTKEDAQFQPEITHKEFARLSNDALINSYDNTILATDRFLTQVRNITRGRNAIIFYISDHGEMLGEDGLYLHGIEHEATQHPAAFMLPTQKYVDLFPETIDALRATASSPQSSNYVFHTVIRLANINTPVLNPDSTFLTSDLAGQE